MDAPELDDLLDRIVADYADRVARGADPEGEALLAEAPAEHRPALLRCFRMIEGGAARPAARRSLLPGDVRAGYRLGAVLGRGAMAVVWRAEESELHRLVALKVLRPGLALDERHVERFHREALAVARLSHPHIVAVHAVGEADGHHYIAMELVDGPSLAAVLAHLPAGGRATADDLAAAAGLPALAEHVSLERALASLLAPVARAVGVAHDLGLVHRDVKPSNILLRRDGRAMVADFGLAKGTGDLDLSLTGEPLGTPAYMSPEQVAQSTPAVDARTDVYSLGVTLYEGLTGRRPFEADSLAALFEAIRHETPPAVRQLAPGCSADAEAVVAKAMARDPERRHRSALELAADLAALAEGRPTQARAERGGPVRRGVGLLAALAGPRGVRYVSPRRLLGLPLLAVDTRPHRPGVPTGVARGWIAVGRVAVGAVAVGPLAFGGLCLGGLGMGLVAAGGLAVGLVGAVGGLVLAGLLAVGGMALGWVAVGGIALGHVAVGGMVFGHLVLGGTGQDPAARAFLAEHLPFIIDGLEALTGAHLGGG